MRLENNDVYHILSITVFCSGVPSVRLESRAEKSSRSSTDRNRILVFFFTETDENWFEAANETELREQGKK